MPNLSSLWGPTGLLLRLLPLLLSAVDHFLFGPFAVLLLSPPYLEAIYLYTRRAARHLR